MYISKILILFMSLFLSTNISLQGKDYFIYSITQDFPMGYDNETLNKNFFINMGQGQGLRKGNILDVYRTVSRLDPYTSKKMFNYKVKIGELEVIHTENQSAITQLKALNPDNKTVQFEIRNFMIGDKVEIKLD